MMNSSVMKGVMVASGAALLMGISSSPPLKDNRFDVTSVSIRGPGTVGTGGTNYAVTVNIKRTGSNNGQTLSGTGNPPQIRPAIYSGNTQLVFQAIDFAPDQNTVTVNLSLRCSNNEVRGSQGGTGHGAPGVRQWWCLWICTADDPAKIKGHLNETESAELSVLCG